MSNSSPKLLADNLIKAMQVAEYDSLRSTVTNIMNSGKNLKALSFIACLHRPARRLH